MTEIVGYVASALILVSITQSSVMRLRVIGLVGSAAFLTYGFLIGSLPIVLTNIAGAAIHTVSLGRLLSKPDEFFEILHVQPNAKMVERFMEFYADDLAEQIPSGLGIDPDNDSTRAAFILRDMVPAGLLVWHRDADGSARVHVDYVTPAYRDLRVGRFVYANPRRVFRRDDVRCVMAHARTSSHAKYLERMGFRLASADQGGKGTATDAPAEYVLALGA